MASPSSGPVKRRRHAGGMTDESQRTPPTEAGTPDNEAIDEQLTQMYHLVSSERDVVDPFSLDIRELARRRSSQRPVRRSVWVPHRMAPSASTPSKGSMPDESSSTRSIRAASAIEEKSTVEEREPTVIAPQVRMDERGNLVIDEASLVLPATVGRRVQQDVSERVRSPDDLEQALPQRARARSKRVVVLEPSMTEMTRENAEISWVARSVPVTSASFAKRSSCERWPSEETELFYRGLRAFGQNYTMIEQLFPNRNRKQIKNKFKKEEKLNPKRVEQALAVPSCTRNEGASMLNEELTQDEVQNPHKVYNEFDSEYIDEIFGRSG